MSEVVRLPVLADSTSSPVTMATTARRGPYLLIPLLAILAFYSTNFVFVWNQQQPRGNFLSGLNFTSSLSHLHLSSNASSSGPALFPSSSSASAYASFPASSSQSAPVSLPATSSLPSSLISSSFHPTCDYPLTEVDPSCPRFTNINLIAKRGLGDRFLQLAIVILVALDTDSVPLLLDMHTVNGKHGNYTGLEDFLPFASSLPRLEDVIEHYPTLRRINADHPGSYRDKITWLKAGGKLQEGGKEGGETGCNLLMTIDMDVCGDFREESCYFLGEPQYTRIRDLVRCWMLKLRPEAIPRLVWSDAQEDGKEGGVRQEQQQQQEEEEEQQCYNVAVHLRIGDEMLHQTDALFFENLKKGVGTALVGFDCMHYHFFYEEDAIIELEKATEEKRNAEIFKQEHKAKLQKEKEKKEAVAAQGEKQEQDEEKNNKDEKLEEVVVVEREGDEQIEEESTAKITDEEEVEDKEMVVLEKNKEEQVEEAEVVVKKGERINKSRSVGQGAPFPILTDIFREEIAIVEESVVNRVKKEKESRQEGREEEGLRKEGEEESGIEGAMGIANNTYQTRTIRKQRIRVSYHGRMDVRSTLYHFMDADMLVLTGSSFPYMAALVTPKPVILMAQPKEASRQGPRGEGTVGGTWFGGYGIGGRTGGIALLSEQGNVISPETDTEWRAMVEMKYLDSAGRRVPYV